MSLTNCKLVKYGISKCEKRKASPHQGFCLVKLKYTINTHIEDKNYSTLFINIDLKSNVCFIHFLNNS